MQSTITNMTLTLGIEPERTSAEVREILGDLRQLLKLRMKRPDATAARIVGVGTLLDVFDDIEKQLEAQTTAGTSTLVAAAGLHSTGGAS